MLSDDISLVGVISLIKKIGDGVPDVGDKFHRSINVVRTLNMG